MRLRFTVKSVLEVEYNQAKGTMMHKGSFYNVDVDYPLDIRQYVDEDGLPNDAGCEMATSVLTQSLISNIHVAHQQGFRNDAEHLRFIISELERGFIENVNIGKSTF
jgi:hypothetical protein